MQNKARGTMLNLRQSQLKLVSLLLTINFPSLFLARPLT